MPSSTQSFCPVEPEEVGLSLTSGEAMSQSKGLFKRTIQHSTLYDRHCIALLGKVFKRTIHGLYNHSTSMTKQPVKITHSSPRVSIEMT